MTLRATLVAALLVAACSSSGNTTFTPPDAAEDTAVTDGVTGDVVTPVDVTGVDAQPDRPIPDAATADVRDATSVDAVTADARDATTVDAVVTDAVAIDRVQPDVATRDVPSTGARCGGRGTPPCADGLFCNFPTSSICGRADGPGTCDTIPEVCPDVVDPVCGCDGESYNNACEAFSHGISVDHTGRCEGDDAGVSVDAGDCRTTGCPSGRSCMGCRGPSGGVFVCIPAGAVC